MALGSKPHTLDPRKATDANGMRIVELLFQSLVRVGPSLKVQPDAAQRWSYKNKTYTFYIPRTLTFSNNRRLKKEDIFFSFQEYRSQKSVFFASFKIIQSVNINQNKDFFIVKIKLKTDSAKFLSADLPIIKIIPKQEIQSSPLEFKNHPIGTGPFKFKSHTSSQITLEARFDVIPAPKIQKVTFKIIRDDFTRFQKMLNKEIDIVQGEMSFQKISKFIDKPNDFNVFRKSGLSMTYLLINFKDTCLQQKNMRKAIFYSINRFDIIKYKLHSFAQEAFTILNPNSSFFNLKLKKKTYNFQKSQLLFKTLSTTCRNKTILFKTSNSQSAISHGKILSLQLQKTGFLIKTESFEWGTFYNDLQNGIFNIALLKWVGVIDPDIYRLAFSSKEHPPKGRNRGFYTHLGLDNLLDQGIQTLNLQKRQTIYHKVQNIIYEDFVIIPLWHEQQVSITQKGILDYSLNMRGDFRYLVDITKI